MEITKEEEKTLFQAYNDMQNALVDVYQRLEDIQQYMIEVVAAFRSLESDVEYVIGADKLPKAIKGELGKKPRQFKGIKR